MPRQERQNLVEIPLANITPATLLRLEEAVHRHSATVLHRGLTAHPSQEALTKRESVRTNRRYKLKPRGRRYQQDLFSQREIPTDKGVALLTTTSTVMKEPAGFIPGTFSDNVLRTEISQQTFEGGGRRRRPISTVTIIIEGTDPKKIQRVLSDQLVTPETVADILESNLEAVRKKK